MFVYMCTRPDFVEIVNSFGSMPSFRIKHSSASAAPVEIAICGMSTPVVFAVMSSVLFGSVVSALIAGSV